jgi:hydroxymethylglutaryl-CoA lyase
MSDTIVIEEQGLRDGLQTLDITIPTAKKLEWIDLFIKAGIRRIQVTSFVNSTYVPQMSDAEAIIHALPVHQDVVFSALALNRKGVERAIATKIKHLAISLSASNTHSLKNTCKSIEQAKLDIAEAISLAKENGITIRAGVQCVFGCRYEGNIDESVVLSLVEHLLKAGANELALADSTGMANPKQIRLLIEKIVKVTGDVPIALHLHNTENKGYANVFAAVEAGIRHFDTAFGGLGGCPFIKNATGNIATEDTVHMLEQMNYTTGVNIDLVKQVSKEMEQILKKPLPGLLYQLNV